MTRNAAYHGALKFFFQRAIIKGDDRRYAWRIARNAAAYYIFTASTEKLKVWVETWR